MRDVLLNWTEVENYTSCNDSFIKYEVEYNECTYQLDVDAVWEAEQEGPPFVAGGTYAYCRLFEQIPTPFDETSTLSRLLVASPEMQVSHPEKEGMIWAEEHLLSPMQRLTHQLTDK